MYTIMLKLYHFLRMSINMMPELILPPQSGGRSGAADDDINYWIPRVRLLFAAEDPALFAKRVATAHKARSDTFFLTKPCTIHTTSMKIL